MTIEQLTTAHPDASDAEIADLYNAQPLDYRAVPKAEVVATLSGFGLLGVLALAQFDPNLPADVRAAVAELMVGLNTLPTLDATDARVRGQVATAVPELVQAGVMTPEAAAAIQALIVVPRADVTADDVAAERRRLLTDADRAAVAAAVNEWQGLLATWVESGEGERPVFVYPVEG